MKTLSRLVIGILLIPACWGVLYAFFDCVLAANGTSGGMNSETISLLGGIAAFALCWAAIPHPVRAYVFGHELTHALWGLFFGARPSNMRVGAEGGSVRLSKTNVAITLAPYFFPFYTFVVIVVALVMCLFRRPLPFLPLWMFMIGFTWAFHVLFTIETLTQQQPDVKAYGRVFSWTIIYLANVGTVLLWLAMTTSLTFASLGSILAHRISASYVGIARVFGNALTWIFGLF